MIDCIHSSGLIPALWGCDTEMLVKVMRGDKLKHPVRLLSGGSVVRGVEWHNTLSFKVMTGEKLKHPFGFMGEGVSGSVD